MSGVGRHVPAYDQFEPKSITLVDQNEAAIQMAKKKHPHVEGIAMGLLSWVKQETRKFKLIVGVWAVSYLDVDGADEFLDWAHGHAELLLLAEATWKDHKKGEQFLDHDQQMIVRHEDAYKKKFRAKGFKIICADVFSRAEPDKGIQECHFFFLAPKE